MTRRASPTVAGPRECRWYHRADVPITFDSYTICLLLQRPDAPVLDAAAEDALQDAHLAHLADLHEAGHLLIAGPLLGPRDRELRGLSIFRGAPDAVRELGERDPAVIAGRFAVVVMPWVMPAGAVRFTPTRLPRSRADVSGD